MIFWCNCKNHDISYYCSQKIDVELTNHGDNFKWVGVLLKYIQHYLDIMHNTLNQFHDDGYW